MGNNEIIQKMRTPKFRASHVHVFKPQAMKGEPVEKEKFSIDMLFKKDESLEGQAVNEEKTKITLQQLIKNAKIAKFGPDSKTWPKVIKSPVKDGDGDAGIDKKTGKTKEGYEGCWIIKASSDREHPPGVVDINKDKSTGKFRLLTTNDEFYSGCYAHAQVYAHVYEWPKGSANYGVRFCLDHVQKLADGKKFGGRNSATEAFADVTAEEGETLDGAIDDDSGDFM